MLIAFIAVFAQIKDGKQDVLQSMSCVRSQSLPTRADSAGTAQRLKRN